MLLAEVALLDSKRELLERDPGAPFRNNIYRYEVGLVMIR